MKETVLFNPSRGAEAKRTDQRQRLANRSVRGLVSRLCCFVLLLLLLDGSSWLRSGASVGSRLASLEEEEEEPLNPRRFRSLAYGQAVVPLAFCFILQHPPPARLHLLLDAKTLATAMGKNTPTQGNNGATHQYAPTAPPSSIKP